LKVSEALANLVSKNKDDCNLGINFKTGEIKHAINELEVYDHLETKKWAIKFCLDSVLTILKVDQIVLSKPAGGPKAAQTGQKPGWDNEEM